MIELDAVSVDNRSAAPAERRFCSRKCRMVGVARLLDRLRCAACRSWFDAPDGPGRTPVFCSDKCRSRRKRELERATKALARDDFDGDTRELLRDARLLWATWFAPESEAGAFWPEGRPPRLGEVPGERVRVALRDRIGRLQQQLTEVERREREKAEREGHSRRVTIAQQERAAEEQAEKAWRRELLGARG